MTKKRGRPRKKPLNTNVTKIKGKKGRPKKEIPKVFTTEYQHKIANEVKTIVGTGYQNNGFDSLKIQGFYEFIGEK